MSLKEQYYHLIMYFDYQTTTYGKWILAGEHAVLRGHSALVFPIFSKKLILSYSDSNHVLSIHSDSHNDKLVELLEKIISYGLYVINKPENLLTGHVDIKMTIPIGVGLGASAALCVAVARLFCYKDWISSSQIFGFAKNLEDMFHGKSSGLDIMGVSANNGQLFQQGEAQSLTISWKPNWRLSFCGEKSMTIDCIQKVNHLWATFPEKAASIDEKMNQSVLLSQQALASDNQERMSQLIVSMYQAEECFRDWGLITKALDHHMQELIHLGALAVKPTGSGGGRLRVEFMAGSF